MDISFITLRRRSPKLLKEIVLLPPSAWRTVELDVPTRKYRTPRFYQQEVTLAGCKFRQLFVQDLGHDEPTILLTNQTQATFKRSSPATLSACSLKMPCPTPFASSTSMPSPRWWASRSISTWPSWSWPAVSTGASPNECVDILRPRHARSSATL